MQDKILDKSEVNALLERLGSEYDVYAPLRDQEGSVEWAAVDSSGDLVWDFSNTGVSPKRFLFPQTECMMRFKNRSDDPEGMIMQQEQGLQRQQALLNIRPCDAKALQVLDSVYCRDETSNDVYWRDKREKTLYLGLACKSPCPTCFCTSVRCGPHNEEGLDVLLVDLEERLLVRPLTEKGAELVSNLADAPDEAKQQAAQQKEEAEAAIRSQVGMENIDARGIMELYEAPMWDQEHESCLNCGVCTYVCPTCHCFDIQDETQGEHGRRVRNWDTCMSWLFTYHTSGHNPRGTKKDRFRQRFMHKFKYMPYKFDVIGCVGCGRCTQSCPVNIDVTEVVGKMNQQDPN